MGFVEPSAGIQREPVPASRTPFTFSTFDSLDFTAPAPRADIPSSNPADVFQISPRAFVRLNDILEVKNIHMPVFSGFICAAPLY